GLGPAETPEFAAVRHSLLNRIVLDIDSQNTIQEIENAAAIFLEHGIERVVLVSSPSHVVRCLRDAAALFAAQPRFHVFQHRIMAIPSITCYEGSTPGDVVVIEPPHRPDRHVLPTHRRIQRMLELQKMPNADVVSLIDDFDDLLQRYEHRFFGSGPP
ncbi:MAG: YdcF family protein, partial [Pirellulaceae bacterium]